jgi:hypothetical protein
LIGYERWLLMASLVAIDDENYHILDVWIIFVLWMGFLDVYVL